MLRTSENWVGGGGYNPGQLGQDIRNATINYPNTTRNTTGGSVGKESGTCNIN